MTWGLTRPICGRVAGEVQKTLYEAIGLVDFRLLAGLAYYANSRGHNSPILDWTFAFIKVFGFD